MTVREALQRAHHTGDRDTLRTLTAYAISRGATYRALARLLDVGVTTVHDWTRPPYRPTPGAILDDPVSPATADHLEPVAAPIPGQETLTG